MSPLQPEFEGVEDLFNNITERRKTIETFQGLLFDNPPLANQANILKQKIALPYFLTKTPELIDPVRNNNLMANLMLNLAFYKRADLMVDTKDIATLAEMWTDSSVRQTMQTELLELFTSMTDSQDLNPDHIQIYIKELLTDIQSFFDNGASLIDLGNLRLFALTKEDLKKEREEILEDQGNSKQGMQISKSELLQARQKIPHLHALIKKLENTIRQTKKTDDQIDAEVDKLVDEEYSPFMESVSAIDLVIILGDALSHPIVLAEIQGLIDTDRHIQAAALLNNIKITDDEGKKFLNFKVNQSILF